MANKLISDLSSAAILVTDLLEHQPIAGPPSKKGTVTALFSDAGGIPSIKRDDRQLFDSSNRISATWQDRQLYNSSGILVADWEGSIGFIDSAFIDQVGRKLINSGGGTSFNWESLAIIDSSNVHSLEAEARQLLDVAAIPSADWALRQLFATDGATVVLDFNTQQPSSGPQTAGAIYTATEQTMLQEAYDALLAYGLLSP
jgi:hypothetical protein